MSNRLFDLWEVPTIEEPVSFSVSDSHDLEGQPVIWRLNLPEDLEAAKLFIMEKEAFIRQSNQALFSVPGRIETLVAKVNHQSQFAFGAPLTEEPLPEPEQHALEMILQIEGKTIPASYALGDTPYLDLNDASSQFQSEMQRLQRMVTCLAWVETESTGRLVGRTVANWRGDMNTFWSPGVPQPIRSIHYRSLCAALQSRISLLQAFVIATHSAARLALILSNPAGAILALPVAWNLINSVLKEVGKIRSFSQ